jgi:GDSL-like lipase/acylhydrolase family protein
VGAVLLGLVATAVLLEGGLWLLSLMFRPEERLAQLEPRPGERRILCIGDSHTFGSHLPAEKAYPGQLQTLLDTEPGQPWRVINLGYPGQNSAEVRLRLARNIGLYRPQIVLCWVGANNTWSLAESYLWDHPDDEPPPKDERPFWEKAWEISRLRGLIRMSMRHVRLYLSTDEEGVEIARASGALPGVDGARRGSGVGEAKVVPFVLGSFPGEEELQRGLFTDLRRMRELCEQNGARLVLSEYPVVIQETRDAVNRLLALFASETGTPFVPIADRIIELAGKYGFDEIWFADHHCTARGNYEVARQLLFGLMDNGCLEERASWRAIPPLEKRLDRGLVLSSRSGERAEVQLYGEPGLKYRIKLECLLGGPDEAPVPWLAPVSQAGLGEKERAKYFGRLNGSGEAQASLRLPTLEEARAMGIPAEFHLWGWRLTPVFTQEGAVEAPTGRAAAVDVPFPTVASPPGAPVPSDTGGGDSK